MTDSPPIPAKRNLPVLTGQSILSQIAWTLGSPSIVLPFLAVSLELPMFIAGALVSVRMVGSVIADVFLARSISAHDRKKRGIALTEVAVGLCLLIALGVATTGYVPLIAAAFVLVFFIIGLVDETQMLMYTDLLGDHVQSKSRMIMRYLQLGVGGLGAIGLALLVHEIVKENPPFSRHSAIIFVSVGFFILSGLAILAMFEGARSGESTRDTAPEAKRKFITYFTDIIAMFNEAWFRRYMIMRLPLVAATLSVPFFALIAAEAHHASAKGLTAMIVSSASGYLVSAPLWQVVNMKSHRAVMVTGNLMVAITGTVLLVFHFLHLDHDVHLHAIALFIVTVAVTGISSARKLYYLDVAPKDQRVKGAAAIKSVSRLVAVILSAALAAVAHMHEVAWAIAFIVVVAVFAAFACYRLVLPMPESSASA